jgi:hypothetical protein
MMTTEPKKVYLVQQLNDYWMGTFIGIASTIERAQEQAVEFIKDSTFYEEGDEVIEWRQAAREWTGTYSQYNHIDILEVDLDAAAVSEMR